VVAIALGLGAALSWGLADFVGGLKSRSLAVLLVLLVSQGAGLVLITAIVAAGVGSPPGAGALAAAAASACAGLVGLAAFYRGLAIGAMAVVAPISATAAVIPVTFGIATGERPSLVQGAGVAIALTGVVLASREPPHGEAAARRAKGVGLALLAAVAFGSFFVLIDSASEQDAAWAIFANRVTAVSVLLLIATALRPGLPKPADLLPLAAIGLLDIGANGLFVLSAAEGLVSVAAVLASLYPVVVILLARAVLKERVSRLQGAGALVALAGVVLISAG